MIINTTTTFKKTITMTNIPFLLFSAWIAISFVITSTNATSDSAITTSTTTTTTDTTNQEQQQQSQQQQQQQECTVSASDGSTTCPYDLKDDDIVPSVSTTDTNTGTDNNNNNSSNNNNNNNNKLDCGIYMAPSTLGDFTNLGMFTAKPIFNEKDGDGTGTVLNYPEIAIPLLFREWGRHPEQAFGDGELWDRYIWEGENANLESTDDYERYIRPSVFVPGLGCTVNSRLELNNIKSTHGSLYDTVNVSRQYHPSAGSFTPYHHAITSVSTSEQMIPAGSELFASYGDTWIPWIPEAAVTFRKNLDQANDFLKEYQEFVQQIVKKEYEYKSTMASTSSRTNDDDNNNNLINTQLLDRLWQTIKKFPHKSRTFSVLPHTLENEAILKHAIEIAQKKEEDDKDEEEESKAAAAKTTTTTSTTSSSGYRKIEKKSATTKSTTTSTTSSSSSSSSVDNNNIDTYSYWKNQSIVSIEWLEEHGKCQDHLRPGISTIPNIGRGAFAARDLPKGTVVGYAPLIHIGQRVEQVLTIHYNQTNDDDDHDNDSNNDQNNNHSYSKLDLIINYSFGHKDSTLLLTPYGAMVNYINHAPTKDMINVKVQWPDKELIAHKPEWLSKPLEFLRDTTGKVGLSFDYVALRDIQQGEEIFIDYGEEWEKAWNDHVQNWKPPKHADRYVHSSVYKRNGGRIIPTTTTTTDNDNHHNNDDITGQPRRPSPEMYLSTPSSWTIVLKTPQEQVDDPYPINLHTLCRESYRYDPFLKQNVYTPVLRNHDVRVPCTVLERYQDPMTMSMTSTTNPPFYLYKVEMTVTTSTSSSSSTSNTKTKIQVINVPQGPQGGIDLYDKAYSQDWHLPQAFRHKMYVPDDIFPESWKNLKKKQQQ